MHVSCAASFLLLAASSATPSGRPHGSSTATPIAPKQDPFYRASSGYESAAPGSVLRLRSAPGNLTSIFNASSAVYNILYRTTNSQYQPAWAVTTVFVPQPEAISRSSRGNATNAALLSYQIPYNTADVDGSPSYALHTDLAGGLVLSDIQTALGRGWYVNVPDFEGTTASFGSGVSEGHATIDSIRAALSSHIDDKLTLQARYALWGYSGGSIASEWAAELAVQYAPEMQFRGVAIGGLAANVTDLLQRINNTPASGLLPGILVGLTNQYPETYKYLTSTLKETGSYNRSAFLATLNYTFNQASVKFANQDVLNDYFVRGNSTIFASPLMQEILQRRDGQMGFHGVPSTPMYVYKAVQDEYAGVEYTDALVDRYCSVGANVTYVRNLAGNHLDEYYNGNAGALEWLARVLDGEFPSGGLTTTATDTGSSCEIQNVTVTLSVHEPFYFPPT